MWKMYTICENDTLETILRKFKIKDSNVILKCSVNKKIARDLKSKKPLKKGLKVAVPDPNAKVYRIDAPGGELIFDAKGWKKYISGLDKELIDLWTTYKREFDSIATGHDTTRKIANENALVKHVLSHIYRIYDPKNSRNYADTVLKRLGDAVKGRKYNDIRKQGPLCEKAINKYKRELVIFRNALTGGAETALPILIWTKRIGAVAGAVAAVTIAAPVTFGSALIANGVAYAGVNYTYDQAENYSRGYHGIDKISETELLWRAGKNFLGGMAGAGVTHYFMRFIGHHLGRYLVTSKFLRGWGMRIADRIGRKTMENMYRKTIMKKLKISYKDFDTHWATRKIDFAQMTYIALVRLTTRIGAPTIGRLLTEDSGIGAEYQSYLKSNSKIVATMDPDKLSEQAAKHMKGSAAVDGFFEKFLKENKKEFEKELHKVMAQDGFRFVKGMDVVSKK